MQVTSGISDRSGAGEDHLETIPGAKLSVGNFLWSLRVVKG